MWQTAEAVVEEGWRACEANRPVVVTGRWNKLLRGILAVIPTGLAERGTPQSIDDIRSRKARGPETDA
jgi:short-subunit dehydrogenase